LLHKGKDCVCRQLKALRCGLLKRGCKLNLQLCLAPLGVLERLQSNAEVLSKLERSELWEWCGAGQGEAG
jgi:hypothetical protein